MNRENYGKVSFLSLTVKSFWVNHTANSMQFGGLLFIPIYMFPGPDFQFLISILQFLYFRFLISILWFFIRATKRYINIWIAAASFLCDLREILGVGFSAFFAFPPSGLINTKVRNELGGEVEKDISERGNRIKISKKEEGKRRTGFGEGFCIGFQEKEGKFREIADSM